jgi:Protein of unknown function (DUF5818)
LLFEAYGGDTRPQVQTTCSRQLASYFLYIRISHEEKEKTMKLRIASGLIALLMLVGAVGVAAAGKDKDKDDKKAQTLTGCLQKGDSANEYMLTAKDGSTWELKSDSVDLAPHVGHTVTIIGTRSALHAEAHEAKEKTKSEMQEHGMAKHATEHGHLKVSNLSMVSDSCQP